jgi:hypothetical protein
MQDRAIEAADVKIDFKQKLVVEELNLSTRKSKAADSRRQNNLSMGVTSSISQGDESSNR